MKKNTEATKALVSVVRKAILAGLLQGPLLKEATKALALAADGRTTKALNRAKETK